MINNRYTDIIIELTDWCNMRCIMCNQHITHTSMHGAGFQNNFFESKNFDKLISDLQNSSLEIGCINPAWSGESTIHPSFKYFLKIIFEANRIKPFFKRFCLNTNGLKFDKKFQIFS